MKIEKKYRSFFIVAASSLLFAACSKMDDYKKYGNGKEISYTGKPDSVIAYSGKKRVKLSWLRSADPKVFKTRIYWNNRTDSIDVPLNNANPTSARLSAIVNNLNEGSYNFELFNFDAQGNISVVSRAAGVVYGDVYEKSLLNRAISSFGKQFDLLGTTVLNWAAADPKSLGVELSYDDNTGANQKIFVAPATTTLTLQDYNSNLAINYRTMFLPDSTAIDTFYAATASKMVSSEILIKNPGNPFKEARWAGRYGDPAIWISNPATKNKAGGVGGLDNLNQPGTLAMMGFEYWGNPPIINGKIYQTGLLPAGTYRLVVNVQNIDGLLENSFLSVAKGDILPDVADINQSLSKFRLTYWELNNKDLTLPFTLASPEIISLGVVGTLQQNNETGVRIRSFKLFKD